LIAELGLADRVHLLGYASNPFAIVGRADFYISASLNEGFPNAMVEAMVLGRPVVATDCFSGPAEILGGTAGERPGEVTHAEFGLVVRPRDDRALAAAIGEMNAPGALAHYGAKALERAEQFSLAEIGGQYWALFDSVIEASGRRSRA
jgi:glycosyltransferase involved in cell wall biosynthesis